MDLNYTIESGDTLIKLADKYETTVDELALLNGIKDADSIQAGQRIVLRRTEEQGNSFEEQANAGAARIAEEARIAAAETAEESSRVQPEKAATNSILSNPVEGPSEVAKVFYEVMRSSEGDHGDIPVPTNDDAESDLAEKDRSLDVGYGHKVKKSEQASGTIHGIPFKNLKTGEYIPLTDSQKLTIKKKDIETEVKLARKKGWDSKLKSRGMSYESLSEPFRLVLEDIAYNVGGERAGLKWDKIFDSMKSGNNQEVVGHLRRKDNKKNTPGMDNRAAKVAYAAGLINTLQEAKDAGLSLANTKEIPLR
jgi:LysM repeat protein